MTETEAVKVDRAEKEKLRTRLDNLILVQANPFIRNFLASKGSTMGVKKKQFRVYLLDLIAKGRMTLADVDDWLDEVEGWGDQRILLWKVEAELGDATFARSADEIRALVDEGLGEGVWGITPTELTFPKKMTLTGADFDGESLRLVWWEGYKTWKAAPELNDEKKVKEAERWFRKERGIQVRLRASRLVKRRVVMRFELRRLADGSYLAALFVPGRVDRKRRHKAIADAQGEIERLGLFRFGDLEPLDVSKIIKYLDQAELDTGGTAEEGVLDFRTRLGNLGAYVEFASEDSGSPYFSSPMVADVRDSVDYPELEEFMGEKSQLEWDVEDRPEVRKRKILVWLWGRENQIEIKAQLSATQVTEIIETLRPYQEPRFEAGGKKSDRAA